MATSSARNYTVGLPRTPTSDGCTIGGAQGGRISCGPSAAHAAAERDRWSSRFTFVLAAIGSAIGLGNFWRYV
eukprot:8795611-Pyramimonas_sp.AAC.2